MEFQNDLYNSQSQTMSQESLLLKITNLLESETRFPENDPFSIFNDFNPPVSSVDQKVPETIEKRKKTSKSKKKKNNSTNSKSKKKLSRPTTKTNFNNSPKELSSNNKDSNVSSSPENLPIATNPQTTTSLLPDCKCVSKKEVLFISFCLCKTCFCSVPNCSVSHATLSQPNDSLPSTSAPESNPFKNPNVSKANKRTSRVIKKDGPQNRDKKKPKVTQKQNESAIKCVCSKKTDEGLMIQCDECDKWLHGRCVGITPSRVPKNFYCVSCKNKRKR